MDPKTARELNAVNRRFYAEHAADFSATRRDPWPGWRRLAEYLRGHPGPLRVLDVGCGNGRFGDFLATALPDARQTLEYVGVDASDALLEEVRARRIPVARIETLALDVLDPTFEAALAERRFSLIALFGLVHHIPGESNRGRLLRMLARRLEPGGWLAYAVWRFEAYRRFRDRVRPWESYNAEAAVPIDPEALEPGDHLLLWGPDGREVRFCHFVDAAESERLIAAAGLPCVAQYVDDGREGDLNRYFLLRMGRGSEA